MNGISALLKKRPERAPSLLLPCDDTTRRLQPEGGLSPDCARTLISDSSSELSEINFCCL